MFDYDYLFLNQRTELTRNSSISRIYLKPKTKTHSFKIRYVLNIFIFVNLFFTFIFWFYMSLLHISLWVDKFYFFLTTRLMTWTARQDISRSKYLNWRSSWPIHSLSLLSKAHILMVGHSICFPRKIDQTDMIKIRVALTYDKSIETTNIAKMSKNIMIF